MHLLLSLLLVRNCKSLSLLLLVYKSKFLHCNTNEKKKRLKNGSCSFSPTVLLHAPVVHTDIKHKGWQLHFLPSHMIPELLVHMTCHSCTLAMLKTHCFLREKSICFHGDATPSPHAIFPAVIYG